MKTYLLLAMMAAGGTCAHADDLLTLTVNTSSLSGSAGYLDYQFNPSAGTPGSQAATVAVLNPTLTGTQYYQTGGVTGTSPLTIANTSGVNEDTQAVIFGGGPFTLTLDFAGAAVTNPVATYQANTFYLSLFDANGNPLLTNAANGALGSVAISPNTGQASLTSYSANLAVATPEPGSLALLGFGMLGLGTVLRRRG